MPPLGVNVSRFPEDDQVQRPLQDIYGQFLEAVSLPNQDHGILTSARSLNFETALFRSIVTGKSENPLFPFQWWLSQLKIESSTRTTSTSSCAAQIDQAYGAGLAVTLPWSVIWRLELQICFWRRGSEPTLSFSFGLYLSFPRVVTWDMSSVCSVMSGDIDLMKAAFSSKEATVFDVLPDGLTFLHVSPYKTLEMFLTESNKNQLAAMENHFEMAKFLIDQGARVNATNGLGE